MTVPTLLYAVSPAPFWATIHRMVSVASNALGVEAQAIPDIRRGRLTRMLNRAEPRRRGDGRVLIAILTSGTDLINLRLTPEFQSGFDRVGVWMVDSFRTDHISRWDSFAGIDVLAISQDYDLPFYSARHSGALMVLPYGADALSQPEASGDRPFDLARFGRQPDGWSDDEVTGARCAARGLRFQGRPPFSDNADENHEIVQRFLRATRCVLAFSNLISSEGYTHRTKPYFSTRWADALSCGTTVAGVPPGGDRTFGDLLWDGALVEMASTDPDAGMDQIVQFCSGWTEQTARTNQAQALLRLDWRWRFKTLFDRLGVKSAVLDAELHELQTRAAGLMAHSPAAP